MNIFSFLSLIRLGIEHQSCAFSEALDWSSIKAFADKQGLTAIVLDGIECLPEELRPPQSVSTKLDWRGNAEL